MTQTSAVVAEATPGIETTTAILSDVREYREVPLAHLRLSPLNPRKHFDPQRLHELAASMANGVGVIEPLVVRPRGSSTMKTDRGSHEVPIYEIVAGARRFKAAAAAGLETVPVSIRTLTDAQVLELMVIENNQRADVTPLEEAAGFKALTSKFGVDIDRLAERIGRSRKYVYDRIKLLDMIPAAQQLLERNVITAGHAILLARLTKDQQARAIDPDGDLFENDASLLVEAEARAEDQAARKDPYLGVKVVSVRELDAWINEHCRFDPTLDVQRELYPATVAKVEQAKKVVHIHRGHYAQQDARDDDPRRIFGAQSWRRADGLEKSKTCDKSATGVVVVGPGQGEAFEVCVNRDCTVHFKAERQARQKAAPRTSAGAAEAEKRRTAARQKEERERLAADAKRREYMKAAPQVLAAVAAALPKATVATLVATLLDARLSPALIKKATAQLGPIKTADDALRVFALSRVMSVAGWEWGIVDQLPKAVKPFGVDVAAIVKAAAAMTKVQTKPKKNPASARGRK